jgi:hypothetical protein
MSMIQQPHKEMQAFTTQLDAVLNETDIKVLTNGTRT